MNSKLTPENKATVTRLMFEELKDYLKRKGKPIPDELETFLRSYKPTTQADE